MPAPFVLSPIRHQLFPSRYPIHEEVEQLSFAFPNRVANTSVPRAHKLGRPFLNLIRAEPKLLSRMKSVGGFGSLAKLELARLKRRQEAEHESIGWCRFQIYSLREVFWSIKACGQKVRKFGSASSTVGI